MPATPTLVVEQADGTERFRLDCITAERTDSLIEMWTAVAVVDRAEWLAASTSIDEIADRFRIERGDGSTFFAGRFRTDEREGNTVEVHINSFEQDARGAEPTGSVEVFENVADSTVAEDAITNVPTLLAGIVETGTTGLSFNFAHAERSKQIRDAAEPAGMDVRFNFDRTVDFLERMGTDRPGTVVSSANQRVIGDLTVEDNARDPVTHIRGLGAQQGDEQVTAEAVIDSYTPGEREEWRKFTNKDVVNQSRLQAIVDRLAEEFDQERRRITVEAGLVDVDLSLGDSVTVELPEHGIDRLLRITRLREILSTDRRYVATLTNRDPSRGGDRKRRDDLGRFNSGYQGFVDRDTDAFGWQPVSGNVDATRPYPYPDDVVSEKNAEVVVTSIPYRAYSQGAASSGGSHDHTVTIPDHSHTYTLRPVTHGHEEIEVEDFTDPATEDNHRHTFDSFTTTNNVIGYTEEEETTESGGSTTTTSDSSTPNHTHDPQPGIIDFPGETASNVDVVVNGTTVATDIGSGEFTETVDISGQLTPGSNTIEVQSDSLGLLNLLVSTSLFRQGTP